MRPSVTDCTSDTFLFWLLGLGEFATVMELGSTVGGSRASSWQEGLAAVPGPSGDGSASYLVMKVSERLAVGHLHPEHGVGPADSNQHPDG